ncbi:hypothetical protein D3C77_571920 [compost metagenome]
MQGLGHHLTLGLALRQHPAEHLAGAMGDPAFGEARQVLAGKAIMQGGHGFVGCRQRRFHVGAFENQRVMGRTKHQWCMKGGLVGRHIHGLWPLHQHPPWLYHPPAQPTAQ